MRNTAALALALLTSIGLAACDVEQTEEGSLPDVDMTVEEGNLPEYEVDAPEIKVGTTETEVDVPDVDVDVSTKETTVDVPVIGVEAGDVDEDQ